GTGRSPAFFTRATRLTQTSRKRAQRSSFSRDAGYAAEVAELTVPEGGFWPAPAVPQPNIYPMEWHVETEKLADIYEKSKRMLWNPADLPWDALDPSAYSREERLGIMYWFSLLANFDASGPAVCARATI